MRWSQKHQKTSERKRAEPRTRPGSPFISCSVHSEHRRATSAEHYEKGIIDSPPRQQHHAADAFPNERFDDPIIDSLTHSPLNVQGVATNEFSGIEVDFRSGASQLQIPPESHTDLALECIMPTLIDDGSSSENTQNDMEFHYAPDNNATFELLKAPEQVGSVGLLHESTEWSSLASRYFHMIEDPPLFPSMENETTTLVQYYFRDTCATWSSFDSEKNPFRTAIEGLWQKSPLIYYAIQSNAAVHLSNQLSSMQATAFAMREKAHVAFLQELQNASDTQSTGDQLLLATLLLGVSACWHDSSDLGLPYLRIARSLIHARTRRQSSSHYHNPLDRNIRFFFEALLYWEMVMAFVSGEGITSSLAWTPDPSVFPWAGPVTATVIPHPWTGVAPRVMLLFAEVGHLVQNYATSDRRAREDQNLVASVIKLEEDLLSVSIPTEEQIADVYDDLTSKNDFVAFAEATRCAALLQLYRVFPDVLRRRLGAGTLNIKSYLGIIEPNIGSNMIGSWLVGLAMHVLNLLASIPAYSGVRCVQLLPLATAAFELRSAPGASYSDVEIASFRDFVIGRLQLLADRLPLKPISRTMQVLQEVWRRNDQGDEVFWLNVMIDKKWKTFLG